MLRQKLSSLYFILHWEIHFFLSLPQFLLWSVPVVVPFYFSFVTGRNCGQGNIFTPVCHSVHRGGVLPQCMLGYHPPPRDQADTPPPGSETTTPHPPGTRQTPTGPGIPPRIRHHPPPGTRQTPQIRHHPSPRSDTTPPPGSDTTPPPGPGRPPPGTRQTPQDQADPPPPEADSSIRSMSGRYASYWNAFLLKMLTMPVSYCSQFSFFW